MKLQKIKLREMSKNTKNKIWNGSILAAFIAAAAVFIIMLQAEKKVLAEYEKITVCVTIDDLPKGESITEDNILNRVSGGRCRAPGRPGRSRLRRTGP